MNNDNYHNCIYLLRNSVNGKIYIGQTTDFKRRMWEHKSYSRHPENKHHWMIGLYDDAVKYGWDKFSHEVLAENIPRKSCRDLLEIHYIAEYNSTVTGYNLVRGGSGTIDTNGIQIMYRKGKYGLSRYDEGYHTIQKREWKKNNPDKVKAGHKRYREAHKEQISVYQTDYRKAHLTKYRDATRRYRERQKEKLRQSAEQTTLYT